LPIHPRLQEVLATMDRARGGVIFRAAQGGILRPRNVLSTFIKDVITPLTDQFPTPAGEIGFEHGRLHSFRHYFCSQAFLGGAGEGEIRDWLGHADSRMVEHYRHLHSDASLRKMEKIEFISHEESSPRDVA
jgi:integrase